jgi:predicted DNA-binding protein YlxM (UPF0122 family)
MDDRFKKLLFHAHFVDQKGFSEISEEFKLERQIVSNSYKELKTEFEAFYNNIRRLRNLFSKKKSLLGDKFQFKDFPSFYGWYKNQEEICFYCKSEQFKISLLVKEGLQKNTFGLTSKRFDKRAHNLEIERKNSLSNVYNETNCVLACYFCNNDKSDYISSEEYINFFSPVLYARKAFIDFKYSELQKQLKIS